MSPAATTLVVVVAPPAPDLPLPDGRVVAVTAAAVDALVARGVEPLVVDDVVDRRALFDGTDHTRWQLDWIDRLDSALAQGSSASGAVRGAVRASAQKLKHPVDSVILVARLAAALIDAVAPDEIVLVADPAPPASQPADAQPADPLRHGHLQFWGRHGDPSLWPPLVTLIAEARGLPVSVQPGATPAHTPEAPDAPDAPASPARHARLRAEVARRTGPARHLDLHHWRPAADGDPATLFLWDGGYGARELVRAERAAGRRVLVLERGGPTTSITEPRPWGRRRLTDPVAVAPGRHPRPDVPPIPEDLLAEIDERAGVTGAAELLRTRLDAFAGRLVPAVAEASAALGPELVRLGVSAVVAANPSSVEEFAVLLAAGRLGIERRLAQHGDHLFSYEGWLVSELGDIDTLLTSDPTLVADVPRAAAAVGCPSPVVRLSEHRRRPATPTLADGPVCYVPGVLMGDTAVIPTLYFDDAGYHRWHLRLLAAMAEHPERRFVWKALPSGDHVDDPIAAHIAAVPNVDYVTEPLPWVLDRVGSVVTDFPSTPAYEARDAGRPLLILWFDRLVDLRPRAVAALEAAGAEVVRCPDTETALKEFGSRLR